MSFCCCAAYSNNSERGQLLETILLLHTSGTITSMIPPTGTSTGSSNYKQSAKSERHENANAYRESASSKKCGTPKLFVWRSSERRPEERSSARETSERGEMQSIEAEGNSTSRISIETHLDCVQLLKY